MAPLPPPLWVDFDGVLSNGTTAVFRADYSTDNNDKYIHLEGYRHSTNTWVPAPFSFNINSSAGPLLDWKFNSYHPNLKIRSTAYYNDSAPIVIESVPFNFDDNQQDIINAYFPTIGKKEDLPNLLGTVADLPDLFGGLGENGSRMLYFYLTFKTENGQLLISQRFGSVSMFACFSGDSVVETFGNNNMVNNVCAKDVKTGMLVNSAQRGIVPILANIHMFGRPENWYRLRQNCLGPNLPTNDLYIKGSHPILLNDKEVLVRDIPEAEAINYELDNVYTFVTEEREAVKINGIYVYTWNMQDWISHANKHGIIWHSL